MERADGASLRTAETVPGVSPRCCATVFSVTTGGFWPDFLVGAVFPSGLFLNHPSNLENYCKAEMKFRLMPSHSARCSVSIRSTRRTEYTNSKSLEERMRDECRCDRRSSLAPAG